MTTERVTPPVSRRTAGAAGPLGPLDFVLFVHGLTAASSFALALLTGRPIKFAEIELTKVVQGAKELQYLLYHMEDVVITSVSRTPPTNQQISTLGQRVEIAYDKINWIYTPVASQPIPTEVLRLRRA